MIRNLVLVGYVVCMCKQIYVYCFYIFWLHHYIRPQSMLVYYVLHLWYCFLLVMFVVMNVSTKVVIFIQKNLFCLWVFLGF